MTSSLALAFLTALLGIAMWRDISTHRIPNQLVLWGMAVALLLAALPGGIGLGAAVGGLIAGMLITLPMYLLRVMGAGDVKLMAATGAFVGYPSAIGLILVVFICGGVLAIAWAAATTGVRAVIGNLRTGLYFSAVRIATGSLPRAADLPTVKKRMPYAVAIASGTFVYLVVYRAYQGTLGL